MNEPLDDRNFDQLRQELLNLIPTYLPEWTDWNTSDPGIALIDLWSHIVEVLLTRLNLLPDRSRDKLLALVGIRPRAAQPAVVDATFQVRPGVPPASVPQRTQLEAQPAEGQPLIFETVDGLDLVSRELTALQHISGTVRTDLTLYNDSGSEPLLPLGPTPLVGDQFYIGFAALPREPGPFSFPSRLALRFFPPPRTVDDVVRGETTGPAPVELLWEYRRSTADSRWHSLAVSADETRGLSRPGYLVLDGPQQVEPVEKVGLVEAPHYWIRATLTDGSYPPAARPRFDFVRTNTVAAEQRRTIEGEVLGTTDGQAGFSIQLFQQAVDPDSLRLELETPTGIESWTRVESLYGSRPADRHYEIDPASATITFGDGRNGRIPVAGSTIIAVEYRAGGGATGNVRPGGLATVLDNLSGVDGVINEHPAVGGADVESVEDLSRRAPSELRSGGALVTRQDFEDEAIRTGGVARARALDSFHPTYRASIPGCITVVVVAESGEVNPQPSEDLLGRVHANLDRRRLLTTELHVVGPRYREITVNARVDAAPEASFLAVKRRVQDRLDQYLRAVRPDPNIPGAYTGWPFGRDLVPTNLYGVIEDVEGVQAAPLLEVVVEGAPVGDLRSPIVLEPDELFAPEGHSINVVAATDIQFRQSVVTS